MEALDFIYLFFLSLICDCLEEPGDRFFFLFSFFLGGAVGQRKCLSTLLQKILTKKEGNYLKSQHDTVYLHKWYQD